MEKPLYNVQDLPGPTRSAVESLVGPLRDDQQLYIVALDRASEPASTERHAAWQEVQKLIDVMHDNVRRSVISADELGRLIDRECSTVRYGGREVMRNGQI